MRKKNLKKSFILFFILINFICSSQITNTLLNECTNQNFENNTLGWELFWKDNYYDQHEYLSNGNGANFTNGSTSIPFIYENPNDTSQGKRILISNFNEYQLETNTSNYGNGDDNFIRIGGELNIGNGCEEIVKKYDLKILDGARNFSYTVVFNNSELYNVNRTPFFKYRIVIAYEDGEIFNGLPTNVSTGFVTPMDDLQVYDYIYDDKKIYKGNININLQELSGLNICRNPTILISFMISDSDEIIDPSFGNLGAFAYIHEECTNASTSFISNDSSIFNEDFKLCTNTNYNLKLGDYLSNFLLPDSIIKWEISNSNGNTIETLIGDYSNYSFGENGNYTLTLTLMMGDCLFVFQESLSVGNCFQEEIETTVPATCIDCTSFSLIKKQKYLISGWTKLMKSTDDDSYENLPESFAYNNAYIGISFLDSNNLLIGGQEIKFYPSGELIDGWQKIQGQIIIPENALDIKIGLINENGNNISAFFDDIRVHPFNGNLKSFVYDQATQKLMAELDENNYATFYEYDKEGGLVRVKKETEKGVFTIQETRSSTRKKD